jgi:hypothetical protein
LREGTLPRIENDDFDARPYPGQKSVEVGDPWIDEGDFTHVCVAYVIDAIIRELFAADWRLVFGHGLLP